MQKADHQHADRRKPQQQTAPVELLEALQAQRVLGQAIRHRDHGNQARCDDLPEGPLPSDVFGPQPGQWRAEAWAERRGQGITGQTIKLHVGRQKAQRDGHQHRRQRTARQALQGAHDQQAFVVWSERAQHAQQGECADGAEGEPSQRERHRAPRRKSHGRHRGRGVTGDQPGAFVVADGQCAADVGEGNLGHHLVQARHQHRQQHAHQADDDPRTKDRWRDGSRAGRGER
ncbi:hypothetical protein D3C85_760210 [compost metagenome]